MNERQLIEKIIPLFKQSRDVIIGPGDDCAVVEIPGADKYILYSIDQIISGIHYDSKNTTLKTAGAKLVKRNISDIAAMGGVPKHALISIAVNKRKFASIEKFYKGVAEEADKWNLNVCGGDISNIKADNTLVSSLCITGYIEKDKLCLRKNAKTGQLLYATGCFGNSYKSKHHLNFSPRLNEALFLAGTYTNTMIDVSDGLLIVLSRIAEASKVTAILNTEAIPYRTGCKHLKNALTDGEDYELLFTISPEKEKDLLNNWPFKNTLLSKIGEIKTFEKTFVIDQKEKDLLKKHNIGYDHFPKSK